MRKFSCYIGLEQADFHASVTEVTCLIVHTLGNTKNLSLFIPVYTLKVEKKPPDGCTQVSVYSWTVSTDANKNISEKNTLTA
jgi:hypothetical protein